MESTTPPERSEPKICCSCNWEILPGELHASHEGKYWHHGSCLALPPDASQRATERPPRTNEHPEDIVSVGVTTGLKMPPALGMPYAAHAEQVYSPKHYLQGHLETIYVIQQVLGEQGFKDFCMGNYIKYRERHTFKNGEQDLKKAEQYLEWATNGLPEPVNGRVPR